MAKHKAVVVGAGGISGSWFPPLVEEKVDVVGVVDLKKSNAVARIKEYGLNATAFTDLKKAIKETKPEFVVDLTIPDAH